MKIKTSTNEPKRGCGYRKQGGHYLVSGGPEKDCGKLPIPLTVCPHCGQGIKFSRGLTWMSGEFINEHTPNCSHENEKGYCQTCPLWHLKDEDRVLLLWVGEKHYKTPADFIIEGAEMGISRRIKNIPRGFKVKHTIVVLAHKKAIASKRDKPIEVIEKDEWDYTPAIFYAFIPQRIEYILTDEEKEVAEWVENEMSRSGADLETVLSILTEKKLKVYKKLDAMEQQGVTFIHLERTDGEVS